MQLLVTLILGLLMVLWALWYRHRYSLGVKFDDFIKVTLPAFAIAYALPFMAWPVLSLAITLSQSNDRPSAVREFLAQTDSNSVVVAMLVGMIISIGWGVRSFYSNAVSGRDEKPGRSK